MRYSPKILIVEDEFIIANVICSFLRSLDYEIVNIAYNIKQALVELQTKEIDCVFLDINLKEEKDGIWLGKYITENHKIPFVYLTAYSDKETISRAVKTNPYGFLNKPIKESELYAATELALLKHNESSNEKEILTRDFIFIKNVDKYFKILFEDILFIESQNNYVLIQLLSERYRYRITLTKMKDVLPEGFVQVHRAYIVNTKHITEYSKKDSILTLEKYKIKVSRNYKCSFNKRFNS